MAANNSEEQSKRKLLYIDKYSGEIEYAEEMSRISDSDYCYLLSQSQLNELIKQVLKSKNNNE